MCNHYRNHPEAIQTWAEYVGWTHPHSPFSEIKLDIWPKYSALVVRDLGGERILDQMTWGFRWERAGKKPGTKVKENTTNIRNLDSVLWRNWIGKPEFRCLVPFTSFAEPKPNAGRDEVWFNVLGATVSAFAGVWRPTDDPARGNVFAFLTCEPNPLVAPYHPKAMPVILDPADYDHWLSGEDAVSLAQPFPSQLMAMAE
jgi:putative SOS response-associated peptidase YedK